MKKQWHSIFMKVALIMAESSTCIRKQVGAVLVKEGRIVSTGYNGVVKGAVHCKEKFKGRKHDKALYDEHGYWSTLNEIHAETNAVVWAARSGVQTNGATIYITLSPCINCAKLLVQAGIKAVYYNELYDRETSGIDFLKKNKVKVEKV